MCKVTKEKIREKKLIIEKLFTVFVPFSKLTTPCHLSYELSKQEFSISSSCKWEGKFEIVFFLF